MYKYKSLSIWKWALFNEIFCINVRYINFEPLCFIKKRSHPNGFYWGHKCSYILTPANKIQFSNI